MPMFYAKANMYVRVQQNTANIFSLAMPTSFYTREVLFQYTKHRRRNNTFFSRLILYQTTE